MGKIKFYNTRNHQLTGSTILLIIVLLSTTLFGGTKEIKLTEDRQLGSHSHFGWSVSLQNGIGLISAPHEDTELGNNAGAVYVYNSDGEFKERLIPVGGQPYDNFGYSVSHDGTIALMSAIGDRANGPFSGSVYIFRNNGSNWIQEQKIIPDDGRPADMFGCSVSIKGNLAVIGARQAGGNVAKSGAVYVFRFDGIAWNQEAKLIALDGAESDFFGHSVALNEDGVVVVGAYSNNGNAEKSGSAYIFEKVGTDWQQSAKLVATDGRTRDLFGFSVSICKERVLVGAYQNMNNDKHNGAAYIFSKTGSGWAQTAKLKPVEGRTHDFFGISVALSDSTLLVGASRAEKDNFVDVGAVYVFKKEAGNWINTLILRPENGKSNDQFGLSIAIENEITLTGSRLNDNDKIDSGTAYFINNSITGLEDHVELPTEFALFQNFPNPFNPSTVIKYTIPNTGFVTLKIYDVLGKEVHTLVSEVQNRGSYSYNFNAGHFSSGVYFYRLKIDNKISDTKKMILLQ